MAGEHDPKPLDGYVWHVENADGVVVLSTRDHMEAAACMAAMKGARVVAECDEPEPGTVAFFDKVREELRREGFTIDAKDWLITKDDEAPDLPTVDLDAPGLYEAWETYRGNANGDPQDPREHDQILADWMRPFLARAVEAVARERDEARAGEQRVRGWMREAEIALDALLEEVRALRKSLKYGAPAVCCCCEDLATVAVAEEPLCDRCTDTVHGDSERREPLPQAAAVRALLALLPKEGA